MKKFYCNGKIVYMHITHNIISAKILLEKLGIAGVHDNVCQALDQDQDMLDIPGPEFDEAVMEAEVCDCSECKIEADMVDLEEFFIDMLGDEDYDHYVLPNGKSAPYGLTGTELAAMSLNDSIFLVSPLFSKGVSEIAIHQATTKTLLTAVDRDLVFANHEKATEAYNALFGDLYGEI